MSAAAPKNRGTIIIDACTLFDLCSTVELQFRDPFKSGAKRYLESLTLLANNGFKIIIPEIVLYETSALLANGKCISDYFPKKDADRKAWNSELLKFLRSVIADNKRDPRHYPNIEIAPTLAPPETKEFLDELKRVTTKYDGPSKKANMDLVKIQKNKHGFGDMGIEALLDEMGDDVRQGHVYLFTNDRGLAVREGYNWKTLHLLDMPGFMKALIESGVHEELGMKKSCNWNVAMDSIFSQLANSMGRRWSARKGYTDYTFGERKEIDYVNQDHPFLHEMKEIGQELHSERQYTENFSSAHKPLSQIERFKARYRNATGTNGLGH